MKIKLTIIFCVGLTIAVFAFRVLPTEGFNLEGVWVVYAYKPGNICGMDDLTATQWIGKKAIFKELLYFEYSKIPQYKDVFKNDTTCNYKSGQKREIVSTNDYFDEYFRESPDKYGINQREILLIHTNCNGTPFQDIMELNVNEITIDWEGIMFFLKRVK